MATNILSLCTLTSGTHKGMTFTWSDLTCTVSGTSTGSCWNNIFMGDISDSAFTLLHTYDLEFSSSGNVQIRIYFYDDTSWSNMLGRYIFTSSGGSFTIPSGTVGLIVRVWCPGSITLSGESVTPEIYDVTYTDVDADIDIAWSLIGYPNSYFYSIWVQFASGALWDGESCSEIACCISYLAGNLSKIYVSNYAQGLVDLFTAAGRYGTTPSLGAFIWFDYNGDGVADHTGRVVAVDTDSGTITTIEGNVGGLVVSRTYYISDSTILGYGYPNYDNDPHDDPFPTPEITPNYKLQNKYRRRRYKTEWN